jgi:hypothetical protein
MSLVRFWWHSDIQDLQKNLGATLSATKIAIDACTVLDATTRAEWETWHVGASDFVTSDAAWINTGTQADQGQKYQAELFAWQQKLSKMCAIAVPAIDPNFNKPDLTGLDQALRYGAIIAGFLGTAYVVGKVAEFIPKPASRAAK